MIKLTSSAKSTFAWLLTGNFLILICGILLVQYFFFAALRPAFPPRTVHSIVKFVQQLKKQPETSWAKMLNEKKIPWASMTVSQTPLYQDNTLLNLKSPLVYDLLKQNKSVQFSVFIKEKAWLNINFSPPQNDRISLFTAILVCILVLLSALILLNYWAVRSLNQPIQTMMQSLQYSENQDKWLPIPLTGNSDQKMLFEQINLLQAKMNNIMQNRTQVVTAISHDLRTPLTRLKLRLEYLADSPHCEKMRKDIDEMDSMIGETLDYFREAHHEEPMQKFDLIALLQSLSEDAADLKFQVQFESNVEKIIYFGTFNLLKRAFSNLINNAIYYGTQAIIRVETTATEVNIFIEDSGTGLTDTDLERVFLPYYRGESSRSRETGGTGLGLTIAKEIIKHHQGTIQLSNRAQGGLRVLVSLPLKNKI